MRSALRNLTRRLPAIAATAALAALAAAAPAAAIPGLGMVGALSISSSANKSVTADCPSGKNVVGTGGSVIPDFSSTHGQIVLDGIYPNAALTSVTATASEDADGTEGTWRLYVQAYCATPPAGLELVGAVTASSSANKSVAATCPTGKRMFGGGAQVEAGTLDHGRVVLDDVTPNSRLTTNTVTALETPLGGGAPGSWRVHSFAICATPPFGLHRAVITTPSNSINKSTYTTCSSGFRVHGGGGDITGGGGAVTMDALAVAGGTGQSLWTTSGYEGQTAPTSNWSLRSYAICAQ